MSSPRSPTTHQQDQRVAVMERIAVQRTDTRYWIDDLPHKLLGNGRPGLIAEMGYRVSLLERYRAWVIGSAAGVTAVLSLLAWIVMAMK